MRWGLKLLLPSAVLQVCDDARELAAITRHHQRTTLLYAGMATNACILDKAVGMRRMQALGLQTYLARDLSAAQVATNPDEVKTGMLREEDKVKVGMYDASGP